MCRGSNVKVKQVIAFQLESLILAQNERWRRGLGMQVERDLIFSILRKRSYQ